MANLSDAFGTYFFDFSNTQLKGNKQAQENFINGLHCITSQYDGDGDYRTYYTDFDIDTIGYTADNADIATVNFGGCGRWAYSCNIDWFTNLNMDESQYISGLNGLVITVDYQDADPAISEIYAGQITLEVKGGAVSIIANDVETFEYNAENAVAYGFYDSIEDYNESNS